MNLISFKKFSMTVLGVLALGLHLGMTLWGTDEKGLPVTGHPLAIALLAVTVLACAVALLGSRIRKAPARYVRDTSSPAAAALGCFAMAGGIAVTVISGFGTGLRLELIRDLCGIGAVPVLIALGLIRFSEKKSFFLLHTFVCIYLTLHTVSHYQIWSSTPQWLHWLFPMAASVTLTLFSYYRTAFAANMGNLQMQYVSGLLALFFCVGAIASQGGMLYLGGAVWTLTNLCNPQQEACQ